MENEKSHDLTSTSWRPRKPGGVIQSQKPEYQRGWGWKSQSEGRRRCDVSAQAVRQKVKRRENIPSFFTSCSSQALSSLMLGKAIYFTESDNSNDDPIGKYLHRQQCLMWVAYGQSGWHKMNHHRLNNISEYEYTLFYLSIHQRVDIVFFPLFGYFK